MKKILRPVLSGQYKRFLCAAAVLGLCLLAAASARAWPVSFSDETNASFTFTKPPRKVVSLSPAISEIIFALGAGQAISGVTFHETLPPEVAEKAVMGGFLMPSVAAVEKLQPDVIFLTSLHKKVRAHFTGRKVALIQIRLNSIDDLKSGIELLGRLFGQQARARDLVSRLAGELDLIRRKVARIPADRRLRVMRIMGRETLMTPGDDSFQRRFIELAGGVAPVLGEKGAVVALSQEKWRQLNPQVIYGCGQDRRLLKNLLSRPGWHEVEALQKGRVLFFPCDLTCRTSINMGLFVSWLAAALYPEEFRRPGNQVLAQEVTGRRPLKLPLPYVKAAQVINTRIQDFEHKTLLVDFTEPMAAVTTLEGRREGLSAVGNHYLPPPSWSLIHDQGPQALSAKACQALGRAPAKTSLLFTGVDMDNLAIESAKEGDFAAYALVTAGALDNALRTASEAGGYREPGTINIIVLTNRRLTGRAMTRALITATEAKTAALQDLDVRSSQKPLLYQATGTGTDNLIAVEGRGPLADLTGGHAKLGELIARAVYAGVCRALARQNGLTPTRGIFRRLMERGLELGEIAACPCAGLPENQRTRLLAELQDLLLQPRYAALVETALGLSDARRDGQVGDLELFKEQCREIAQQIAGRPLGEMKNLLSADEIPPALHMALNALLNGALHRR